MEKGVVSFSRTMEYDLGFDYKEACERQKLSTTDIENLRNSVLDIAPKTITNKQLALFLDACGSVEGAQKVVELYFKARKNAPEHFSNRDPFSDETQQCLDNQNYVALPPSPSGYPIIFHQLSNSKASNYHFDNAIKTFFMTLDVCFYKYGPRPGVIFLFDMRNVRLSHLLRVRISSIRKYFHYVQEAVPGKLHQIHILNVVPFFDKILTLIRPFMKAELFKLLFTHPPNTDMNEFFKQWIPKECIPCDFGGSLPSVEECHNTFRQELMDLRSYFIAEEKQRHEIQRNSTNDLNENMTKLKCIEID